jgi:hypothetical protein
LAPTASSKAPSSVTGTVQDTQKTRRGRDQSSSKTSSRNCAIQ